MCPLLRSENRPVFSGCPDEVLSFLPVLSAECCGGCIDNGRILSEGIKKGFAEKPHRGLLGKVIIWWVQGTAGRLEHSRRAWREKGSESHWDWIPLGPVGFYFALDGRGLWSILSQWVRIWYMLKDHSGCCVENWLWWAEVEVLEQWCEVLDGQAGGYQIGMDFEGRAGRPCWWVECKVREKGRDQWWLLSCISELTVIVSWDREAKRRVGWLTSVKSSTGGFVKLEMSVWCTFGIRVSGVRWVSG